MTVGDLKGILSRFPDDASMFVKDYGEIMKVSMQSTSMENGLPIPIYPAQVWLSR